LEKDSGRPIGSTFFRDIDYEHEKAEVGLVIGEKDAWGSGYGTEATSLMVDYAFNTLGLHKVFTRILADNIKPEKICITTGFSLEGRLKDDVKFEGKFVDVLLMAKIKDD
jgi:RimJ/RimL family protein N-acetyltransferase